MFLGDNMKHNKYMAFKISTLKSNFLIRRILQNYIFFLIKCIMTMRLLVGEILLTKCFDLLENELIL